MYSNQLNIPLPLAVFLAHDEYNHEPNVISATTLMKPVRQVVLNKRINPQDSVVDISNLIASRMGTAIHAGIEKAWTNPKQSLRVLGYPAKVYDNIIINPENFEELVKTNPDLIPVYMEIRSYRELLGFKVSGQFDFVAEGMVEDFKSTSVYTFINQSNVEKYRIQGSIYRWLNPNIITKDTMRIHYIFTDFSKLDALRQKNYPPNRVHAQYIPLMSLAETEHYIQQRLLLIQQYMHTPEHKIPECSDEDLWRSSGTWAYYKDPNKTVRSTRTFDNLGEAQLRLVQDGNVGIIKERKGQVKACKFCNAFALCTQKDKYLQSGELTL